VEYRIAELYTALAPIVQDVGGAHWDATFDLVESGLEVSIIPGSKLTIRAPRLKSRIPIAYCIRALCFYSRSGICARPIRLYARSGQAKILK